MPACLPSCPARRLLLASLLCWLAQEPSAQAAQSPFGPASGGKAPASTGAASPSKFWTKQDGLPDERVHCLLQSQDGYLWIGTRAGLARFDGIRFTVFNRGSHPEMVNHDCRGLVEDAAGALWILTSNGVLRWHEQKFRRYTDADGLEHCAAVNGLAPDPSGRVWVSSPHGLGWFENGQFHRFNYGDAAHLCCVSPIVADGSGILWMGGDFHVGHGPGGLMSFTPGSSTIDRAPWMPDVPRSPGLVRTFSPDGQGGVWALLSTDETFAVLGHYKEGSWRSFLQTNFLNGSYGLFLLRDSSGSLWLPRRDTGLPSLDRFSNGKLTSFPLPVSPSGPPTQILCLCIDHEGNFWVGTERHGLLRWRPPQLEVISRAHGLPDEDVWALSEDRDGGVWIGTGEGLACFRNGACATHIIEGERRPNAVRALAQDHAGRLWIGTGTSLNCLAEGELSQHHFEGEWYNTKVRALCVDRAGSLWVGTATGLWRVRLQSATENPSSGSSRGDEALTNSSFFIPPSSLGVSLLTSAATGLRSQEHPVTEATDFAAEILRRSEIPAFAETNGLPHHDVRALCEDRSGRLWIGTAGGGVACLKDGQFRTFMTTNGLSSNHAWALHEGADGSLWVGTEHGLNCISNGRIDVFTSAHGLLDDKINQVLEDDLGNMWIGTDRVIYRVRRQELLEVAAGRLHRVRSVPYSEADGLPTTETNGQKNQPGAIKTRDGRIWFATPRGAVVFDPRQLPDVAAPPLAVIEEVLDTGQPIFDNAAPVRLAANSGPRAGTSKLTLPPARARVLEFRYTANTFLAPQRARFKYRLDGYDKAWHDAGSRRSAYYTNLRPGDYRFELLAANHQDLWSESAATMAFRVQPFVYQTWWFRVSAVSAVLGLILWAGHRRLQTVRRRAHQQAQAALAAERERLARDLHDDLGPDLTRLQRLAEQAERDPSNRDAFNLLAKEFAENARGSARRFRDALWATYPADPSLEGLAARLQSEAQTLLNPSGVRCRFDIPVGVPEHPLTPVMRRELLLFVREALTNVARHAAASEAVLRIAVDDGQLALEVRDDGRGFHVPELRVSARQPAARGMNNLHARAAILQGQLRIQSRPGTGTSIRLTVPLRAE